MQVASHPQQHRWLAEAAHSASASCWDHHHQLVGCQMVGHLHWQSNLASEPIPAVASVAIPDNSDKHSYRTGGDHSQEDDQTASQEFTGGRVKRAGFACSQPPPPTSGSLAALWPGLCRSLCRPLPSHQPPSQQSPVACKFRSASSGSEKPWPSMPSQLWFGSPKKKTNLAREPDGPIAASRPRPRCDWMHHLKAEGSPRHVSSPLIRGCQGAPSRLRVSIGLVGGLLAHRPAPVCCSGHHRFAAPPDLVES
ncbi:hypothetical protein EDB80DRAFT_675191 [Ilyonectria destructans]|nr:hypothetical protein EDB80DRAFT_675191 [Ilyonectria destructans]